MTIEQLLTEIKHKIASPNYLMNSVEKGRSGAYITMSADNAETLLSEVSRLQIENAELKRLNDK